MMFDELGVFFVVKQKTAYEMRISDWSSDGALPILGHYITANHYVPLVYPVQVNLKWWKGLTQAQRDTISKAVANTEGDAVANIEKEFTNDIALAKKNGNEVYRPTEDRKSTRLNSH